MCPECGNDGFNEILRECWRGDAPVDEWYFCACDECSNVWFERVNFGRHKRTEIYTAEYMGADDYSPGYQVK